jgi:signal transduction histidine kinase
VTRLNALRLDAVLAVACGALALTELFYWDEWSDEPEALQLVGTLVICAAVALRRRHTLTAVIAQLIGSVILVSGGNSPEILAAGLAGMILAYSIAAELSGRRLLVGATLLATAIVLHDIFDPQIDGFDIVIDLGFFALWFAVGMIVRRRDRRVEVVVQLSDDRVQDAVKAERDRIARELHDVIAHGMSVMVVQADAARHSVPESDRETRTALAAIERTGRDSMREMRRLLHVLRGDQDETALLAPQPGLRDLDALAATMREAGLPVELRVEGEPVALTPGVDLAAYRIVQEALTNALRHAGPATALVEVGYGKHELTVRIADTGLPRPGSSPMTSGNGLIGLRERTRLYGGTFRAEREAHGFTVTASLPFEPTR